MVVMLYLLALSFLSFLQVEEVHVPGCTCKISGVEAIDARYWCGYLCPKENDTVDPSELQRRCVLENVVAFHIFGFLDVEADCEVRVDDKGEVELSIAVEKGSKYIVGEIHIEIQGGEFDVAPLRETLIIHPGDVCNQQLAEVSGLRIQAVLRRLMELEGWDSKPVELKLTKHPELGLVDLFYVVKIPSN